MAKNSTPATPAIEQDSPARSAAVDVTPENGRSLALAAAFDGLFHLFQVRVTKWVVTAEGIFAEGVSCAAEYDLDRILNDVSRHVRRAQLWPTISWIMLGTDPEDFSDPAAITTFMTQYFKGAEDENSSKTPAYVLGAAKDYKVRTGTAVARGPKPKTINLKNLSDTNIEQILKSGVSVDDLAAFVKTAQAAIEAKSAPAEVTA